LIAATMGSIERLSVINPAVLRTRELHAIAAPALLLIGDGEKLYDPEAMLALARRRMPKLEGAIVTDADHVAAMAQPDDVNERIVGFLQRSVVAG
jgi:pimeloyl-ACP methyl ester carboxylesterase